MRLPKAAVAGIVEAHRERPNACGLGLEMDHQALLRTRADAIGQLGDLRLLTDRRVSDFDWRSLRDRGFCGFSTI
jgi:hypothetical protein